MHVKDAIRHVYGLNDRVVKKYLEDLSDADLLVRPEPGMNHIAWQMGHLISSERHFLEMVKPGSSPPLPDGFDAVYGRKPEEVSNDDPSCFLSKDQYVELMDAQRAATVKVLDELTDEELAAESPESVRNFLPTVGTIMILMVNHYLMHAGQWVAVRRKLGKPVAI